MFTMDLDKLNVDEQAVKAFVQQQLVELTPHLAPESPVSLKLTQREKGYEVEMSADHAIGTVETVGQGDDLFLAIKNAKDGLLEYFTEIDDELNPEKREQKIQSITRGGSFYLH